MEKTYKIRKFTNGKSAKKTYINYSLTIPSHIATNLPEDMTFACELTPEGILFRPAKPEQEQVVLPDWAANKNGGTGKKTSARAKPRSRPGKKKSAAKA